MAIITTFQTCDQRPKPKKDVPDPVDMSILEYFYAATMNDILSDDKLIRLIDSNGFYKTSFLEAFDLCEINIEIDKNIITWVAPAIKIERSNLDIFKHLNKEENINDIHKYTNKSITDTA